MIAFTDIIKNYLITVTIAIATTTIDLTETKEFCNMETFIANCSHIPNNLIVVEAASYGLMRLGRCLKVDYSNKLGCRADVMAAMDRHCSGKVSCSVKLPDEQVYSLNVCPPEVTSYLEASYFCLNVEPENAQKCETATMLTSESGHISSLRSDLGRCRWFLKVPKGRRINITLIDFFHQPNFQPYSHNYQIKHPPQPQRPQQLQQPQQLLPTAISNINAQQQQQQQLHKQQPHLLSSYVTSSECLKYAIVKETTTSDNSPPKISTICGGGPRVRTVYLSDTNSLEVSIYSALKGPFGANGQIEKARFLLKYKAFGCPDLDPRGSDGWTVIREGEKSIISCNGSHDNARYHLICEGDRWLGDIPTCSARTADEGQNGWALRNIISENWASSQGLVTVIVLGIALGVILGIVMLVPLLFYFKRRDMMRHKKIIMVSPNARDVQLGDPMIHQQQDSYLTTNTADNDNHHNSSNDHCQQYDCEEKSTFLDEGRTGYGGWYSSSSTSTIQQQGKTTCCPNLLLMSSPPLLQQPQTLIPQNDIWPICPVQHKKQQQQQQFLLQQQHEKQHSSNNNNNFNINNDNNNNNNNNVSASMYMSKCPILNDHLDHDYDLPK